MVGGFGVPELMITLYAIVIPLIGIAIIFVIAYFVIRNAVAAGILRAEKLRKQRDDSPDA